MLQPASPQTAVQQQRHQDQQRHPQPGCTGLLLALLLGSRLCLPAFLCPSRCSRALLGRTGHRLALRRRQVLCS